MGFSEEQVKDIAAIREDIAGKIAGHQAEIDMLEKTIAILDETLKTSSFSRASQLERRPESRQAEQPADPPEHAGPKPIPITGEGGGPAIANAYVTPESISIILEEEAGLREDVPPFQSFFIGRIVGEMKRGDEAEVQAGRLQKESAISCTVSSGSSGIKEITIKNYRDKKRADELVSSAGWSLRRMLEKAGD